MRPTLYNYQLQIETGAASSPFKSLHYFQTLSEAVHTLLTHVLNTADHVKLAEGSEAQTVGVITETGTSIPLLTAKSHPLSLVEPDPKAGLKLTYHLGTIGDLGHIFDAPMKDFASFHEHRNYLWLADYQRQDDGIAVTLDPGIFKLQDALAVNAFLGSTYQFKILEGSLDDHKGPVHPISHTYYFANGLSALWALTRHPYLDEGNWAPFTEAVNPAQLTIVGPKDVVLAESRLVAHNDPVRHLYPQAGLYLKFPAGFESYLQAHAPDVELPATFQPENNAILLTHISTDNQRLIPTPAYHDLQYLLSGEISSRLAPPYGGYYIELAYLPTRTGPDQQADHPLHIERTFPNTFRQGLDQLQAQARQISDRTSALLAMQEHYLVGAVMYDSGKEIARLFKIAETEKDLPPGLYLEVNRENLTPNALAKLGIFLSEASKDLPFNILLSALSSPLLQRKHGTSPRTLRGDGGSHRAI